MRQGKLRLNNAYDITSMQKMPSSPYETNNIKSFDEEPEGETYYIKRNKS